LAAWPWPRWLGEVAHLNDPQTEAELAAVRRSVQRGRPFGEPSWSDETIRRLGLASTLRPQVRPKEHNNGS
jgi:putative transposase